MKNITINDKVNRAIKKYGYEPNELARSLTSPPTITTAEYLVGLFESE
jgi:DNA-binding LacI/PurR family transcriptional regulator